MECYTTGPTTPNNSSAFYDNNNYGDQQLSNEHHNQHYYTKPAPMHYKWDQKSAFWQRKLKERNYIKFLLSLPKKPHSF